MGERMLHPLPNLGLLLSLKVLREKNKSKSLLCGHVSPMNIYIYYKVRN